MIRSLFVSLALVGSSVAFGQAAPEAIKSIRFTPCSSWTYSSDVNGYVCSFTGFREEAPDMYEFRDLEQRVRNLEQQIRDLEAKLELALQN
jgi:hypothetical protein